MLASKDQLSGPWIGVRCFRTEDTVSTRHGGGTGLSPHTTYKLHALSSVSLLKRTT